MKFAIKIWLALWMSAWCLTSGAAVAGGVTGGRAASAVIVAADAGSGRKDPSGKKKDKKRKRRETAAPAPALSPGQQRKYDYYFLEAVRLKNLEQYDAAFEMLRHCLALNPTAASAHHELAQYYMFLKQVPQGQAALEKAVEYAPDNFWYAQDLASLYMQQKDLEKAAALLEQMTVRFAGKLDPLYSLLAIYETRQEYDKVIGVLDRLEEMTGKSEQLSMEKFQIYQEKKDTKRAFREIESLVAEYPRDLRYQVVLGDVYLQNGKPDEAYSLYRKVLDEEPDNAQAMYSLATYYEETGQQQRYEQQLDSLLLNRKVEPVTRLAVMRSLIVRNEQAGGDSLRVIGLFDRIMEQEPDDPQLPLLYAQYLISKQMNDRAMPVLRTVLDIDPTNTAARMTLLGDAVEKKDNDAVIDLCEGGVEANPDRLEFYFYLAIGYNQAERTDDLIATCHKALEHVTPESKKEVVSDFYNIMADAYHMKNQNELAFAAYDSALVYNPNNIGALNNYAYFLSLERRDLDRAEEMSYKTVKAEPDNATYLDTYAWILFEKGNYAEARIYIDDALKNGSDSADVVEHCGDIYYMTGDVDGALKFWKQALEMGSESVTLKDKIRLKKYIPAPAPPAAGQ